jgi:hypothetical protein
MSKNMTRIYLLYLRVIVISGKMKRASGNYLPLALNPTNLT